MTRLASFLPLLTVALLSGPAVVAQSVVAQSLVAQAKPDVAQPAQVEPPTSMATLTYTVKTGDTLYRIATDRGLKVEDLIRFNNLTKPTVEIGQVLRLPTGTPAPDTVPAPKAPVPVIAGPVIAGPEIAPPAGAPAPPTPATSTPAAEPSVPAGITVVRSGSVVGGVTIKAPARLKMGDGFVLRLAGEKAGEAVITFPSELGEDVRQPAEALRPIGAAGEYRVLGRVVLGKTTPLLYRVQVGSEVLKGSIPVSSRSEQVQHLTLPKALTDRLTAKNRPAEEQVVEAAYALRTPQAWSRPFSAPLASAVVSSSFGQPRTYLAGGPVAYHYGMDFPAKVGTPVRAVNDGTVVIAATFPVRGGLVGIDHGAGLVSLYFHQSKVLVKVGQKIARGQVIGQVGTTGLSAGPHLHLEMRVRGEATLPTLYFNRLWP